MEVKNESPVKSNQEIDPEILKKDPDANVWKGWQGAVLLKDEIRRYCTGPIKMIVPFIDTRKFLKPASYHLRLGSYYRKDGEDYKLSDDNKILKIPRHGIVIARTHEWINMPAFLVGRWNLKVKMVYKGLVWVGSLQVDPGYQGYLFCPLYNLSNKEQELIYKDPLFTIDFVRTTLFDETKGCELWKPQTERPVDSAADLDTGALTTAPIEDFEILREELDANKKIVNNFQSRIDSFQVLTFTVLGILVAALSFIGIKQFAGSSTDLPTPWDEISWGVMVGAIALLVLVLVFAGIRTIFRK